MISFHQILTLARVPNVPTVVSNVLMAWVLAGGEAERWPALALAVAGSMLVYAGGCTLNDVCDAAWDARHKPDRLIPSGAVTRRTVLGLAELEMSLGTGALLLACYAGLPAGASPAGPGPVWTLPLLLAGAVLLYSFRHKENPASVVVMGACRALLVLSAAAAAGRWNAGPVLAGAGVLWIYIILLSLLARRESRPGGALLRRLRPAWSVGRWVGEMLAAIPLLDAALILIFAPGHWRTALICLVLWPLCRLLQRKYAAT